jgi:hypothetical protein
MVSLPDGTYMLMNGRSISDAQESSKETCAIIHTIWIIPDWTSDRTYDRIITPGPPSDSIFS